MFARLSTAARQSARTVTRSVAVRSVAVATVAVAAAAYASRSSSSLSSPSVFATVSCAPAVGAPATLPLEGIAGTNYERTFIAIKPDGVQLRLIAKIIARFEEKGFQLVGLKLITPTKTQAEEHYADLSKKGFFPALTTFFSSGPIIAMVWQGKGAILTGRKLLGETDPAKSAPGTIRGDYSIDIGRNICHGSDGPQGAKDEINYWFKPTEIFNWNSELSKWTYEKP